MAELTPQDLMRQLVAIPSVFPNESDVSHFIEKFLLEHGLAVERVLTQENRPNLVATSAKGNAALGFYGHIDTVKPALDYTRDPFRVEFDGEIARGLGVGDMKGGVACIMCAAVFAAKNRIPAKFIFGVDEENISIGAHDLIDSGKLAGLRQMIVAESGQIRDQNQPFSVCYGRRGRFVMQIEVIGRSAHAAEASAGLNAIVECAKATALINSLEFNAHPSFGATTIVIDYIEGSSNAFSVPERCELRASVLTTPLDKSAQVCQRVKELLSAHAIEVNVSMAPRATPYAESYEVARDHEFVRRFESKILHPNNVVPIYTGSVADENVFASRLAIPVITLGPIAGGDHTATEWVSVPSLANVLSAYQAILSF